MAREDQTREWQARVGLTDEDLYADYCRRIAAAGIFTSRRAIDERSHQFVDQSFVERLHVLADELGVPREEKRMTEHTSTRIAHREAGVDEFGEAFEKWLDAEMFAKGRDVMDEDIDLDDLFGEFRDHYRQHWASREDFAWWVVVDQGVGWSEADYRACEQLGQYLNWTMIADEMFNGNYTWIDGYVFEDEV